MIERLLVLNAVAVVVAAAYVALLLWQARRVRALAADRLFADIVPDGLPAVVAFTLPGCADCKARQAPALRRLSDSLGERVHVLTLTVSEHPALADKLGLLTVPATAVVDGRGVLRHLNQGFADENRLLSQLSAAG